TRLDNPQTEAGTLTQRHACLLGKASRGCRLSLAPAVSVAAPIADAPLAAAPINGCVAIKPRPPPSRRRVGRTRLHNNNGRPCRRGRPIGWSSLAVSWGGVVVQRSSRVPIAVPITRIPAAILSRRQRCAANQQSAGNRHYFQGSHHCPPQCVA